MMMRALRAFSRAYCPRQFNITGCTFEESNTSKKTAASKECILPGFQKEIVYRQCVSFSNRNEIIPSVPTHDSYRKSWKKYSRLHQTRNFFEALSWGSIFALGFQFGLPLVKSHVRNFGQNVMDGNIPSCPCTPRLSSWRAYSMPFFQSSKDKAGARLSVLDCKQDEHRLENDCQNVPKSENNNFRTKQHVFKSSHSKSLKEIVEISHSDWPYVAEKSTLDAGKETALPTIRRCHSVADLPEASNTSEKCQTKEDCMVYLLQHDSDVYLGEMGNNVGLVLVPKNIEDAFICFKNASLKLNKEALFNLGMCYENGLGTSKDIKKAMKSYKEAAAFGHKTASFNLAVLEMSEADDATFGKGLQRLIQVAEDGMKEAQSYVGTYYSEMEEWEKASKMFKSAASQGDVVAMNNLGLCYENGWGVDVDLKEAYCLYTSAARSGCADAMYRIALFHEYGYGALQEDLEAAMKWYNKAAERGNIFASERIEEHGRYVSAKENECNVDEKSRKCKVVIQEVHSHYNQDISNSVHISQSSPELSSAFKPKFNFNIDETNVSNYLNLFLPNNFYSALSVEKGLNSKFWIGDSETECGISNHNLSHQNVASLV